MAADLMEVGIVANVVADSVLLHIAVNLGLSRKLLDELECLQDRRAVGSSASQVVHFSSPWRLDERCHEPRDVERMDIVPNLFALVAEDFVFALLKVAFDEVAEEPVQLYSGVVGSG